MRRDRTKSPSVAVVGPTLRRSVRIRDAHAAAAEAPQRECSPSPEAPRRRRRTSRAPRRNAPTATATEAVEERTDPPPVQTAPPLPPEDTINLTTDRAIVPQSVVGRVQPVSALGRMIDNFNEGQRATHATIANIIHYMRQDRESHERTQRELYERIHAQKRQERERLAERWMDEIAVRPRRTPKRSRR